MSGFASSLRLYQQKPISIPDTIGEDTMTNSILKRALAMTAAASTTLIVFSGVASLADSDKAALLATKSLRGTQVAQATSAAQR
jgi:hypothetical protein